MAVSYSAVIDLRVDGLNSLKTVEQRVSAIENLTKRIKPIPTLFTPAKSREIQTAKNNLSALVKAYADGDTRAAKFSTSIAGVNTQLNAFNTLASNAKTGSDQFTNALTAAANASRVLLTQELQRLSTLQSVYQRKQAPGMTAPLSEQGVSGKVQKLLDVGKGLVGPGNDASIAALERYQAELLDVQRLVGMTSQEFEALAAASRRVDIQLGKVEFGPATADSARDASRQRTDARNARRAKNQRFENLALGAGFPLLFGGGPGTVAGSVLGSFVGTGFGGQILGGALGQTLDQAVQAASKLGNSFALVGNNYSSLREQGIEFTAEIERQVTAAKKLGDYTKAQELTRGAVFTQTGDVGGLGAQAGATAVNELQKAWNGVTKAVQTLLGFLGTPFIFVLTAILRAVQGVVALINLILTGVIKLLSLIPGLNGVLNQAYQSSLKGTAEYENQLAELDKQIGAQNQVLALEKSRTAISSQMVGATKEQQKELEKQLKITELRFELERKIAEIQAASPGGTPDQRKTVNALLAVEKSIFDEKVKQLEVDFRIAEAKERELEIQKRQESQIRATAMLSEGIVTAATTHLQNQASIASAATSAYLALNDLEMQRATNAGNTEKQYNLQLQRAQLIYQQTVLQVEQEQRKAQLAVLSSQIKLKELEATVAQKAAKNEAYAADYAAVELQKQAVQLAYEGVNAAKLIAEYNLMGANAIHQKTVEMAAFNRTQAAGRASGGGGGAIGGGGGGGGGAIGGGGGVTVTSMGTTRSLGAATPQQLASQLSAKGLSGAFTEQQASATLSGLYEQRVQKYIDDRAAKGFKNISPTSVSDRQLERAGFAEGGFVTRPTDAMVGEGGQPEYVIPASKMNDAVRRYSAGTRGEAVVSGAMSAGGANSTSNYSNQQNAYYGGGTGASVNITTGPVIRMDNRDYVTMTDMQRGMAAAAGASQASMMRSMSRSYATRRSMGL
jgi:hypothetical protein